MIRIRMSVVCLLILNLIACDFGESDSAKADNTPDSIANRTENKVVSPNTEKDDSSDIILQEITLDSDYLKAKARLLSIIESGEFENTFESYVMYYSAIEDSVEILETMLRNELPENRYLKNQLLQGGIYPDYLIEEPMFGPMLDGLRCSFDSLSVLYTSLELARAFLNERDIESMGSNLFGSAFISDAALFEIEEIELNKTADLEVKGLIAWVGQESPNPSSFPPSVFTYIKTNESIYLIDSWRKSGISESQRCSQLFDSLSTDLEKASAAYCDCYELYFSEKQQKDLLISEMNQTVQEILDSYTN